MNPYLMVNGNFVRTNGMDMPNLALATYLADQESEVHLVTHRADQSLANRPNVIMHHVPKPAGSYLLAAPVLDRIGRRWAKELTARNGCILVNGGNCRWAGVNWVHYVHAAYPPIRAGSAARILKNELAHRTFLKFEREALAKARIVIANSNRTKQDLVEYLQVAPERVRVIYYGIDAAKFRPATDEERIATRRRLGWNLDQQVVAFVGALGDRRKGFDSLFAAFKRLCEDPQWNVDLAVIGAGAELPAWKRRATQAGLESRCHFLGFRTDVPDILSACDALVSPTRYEAYGQGVHEALCCGLPALVSKDAGIAERFPDELHDLLIPDPDDVPDIVERLSAWHNAAESYRESVDALSNRLRAHTWNQMAEQIVSAMNSVQGEI